MGLFNRLMRRRNMNPRRTGLFSGLAGLRNRLPARRNMFFGGRRRMNPFLGMNNLPRMSFLPPSIAEARGRNMDNVGLLPDYMQPGGSGMPETDNRFADMPQPPEMQTSDMRFYTDAFGNQQTGSSSMAQYHNQLKEYFAANPGAQDYYMSQNQPSKMPPVTQPFGNPTFSPVTQVTPNPQPTTGQDRIGNYNLERENFFGTPNKGQPISPTLPMDLPPMPDPVVDMQGRMGMAGGGEVEFPDLSGDGEITQKDILMGKGVIKMNEGGDPAEKVEESFTDYQPEGLLKGSIFDYIPDGYQVSAFLQDKFNRPMPVKDDIGSDLLMIDNDADFRNLQNALMNYRNFYASQPTGFQQFLPSPDQLMENPEALMNIMKQDNVRAALGEEGSMVVNDIDMMLRGLDNSEKKSPNFPMMSR